ncbi:MAG: phosphoesterase, PA-phosphatase related [Sediminibacterium sp.]|nr:phosphoesterase, PA-phosphatase related [Sediminibacterium sp.]
MHTIPSPEQPSLFAYPRMITIAAISVGYLLLSWLLIGFKMEQVYLVLLFNGFYFSSRTSRKFITGFSVFIVFWIIFDYMKAFPNYRYQAVHIESLYHAEKKLFGIHSNGLLLTPNEYWRLHGNTLLDILSGIFYLCWVPVPLVFAGYIFFKNRVAFMEFALTFLLVNLVGFAIYYLYPAAPPWYVQHHGFEFIAGTPGNTAGLEKFDTFFHTSVFKGLYAKSSNVFAAMPSLHSAYPLIVFFYAVKFRLGRIRSLFAVIMAGIWFSAVYSSHHYVLDVLAGICCAGAGIIIFQWAAKREGLFKKALLKFEEMII